MQRNCLKPTLLRSSLGGEESCGEMFGGRLYRHFPTPLKYFLLFSIPSLTFLGLISVVRRRWLRRGPGEPNSATSNSVAKQCVANGAGVVQELKTEGRVYSDSLNTDLKNKTVNSASSSDINNALTGEALSGDKNSYKPTLLEDETSRTKTNTSDEGKSLNNSQTSMPANSLDSCEAAFSSSSSQIGKNALTSSGSTEECKESKNEASGSCDAMDSTKRSRVRIQLQLQRDVIGRFIGKQGRNIKALMQESGGAYVYLNQKSVSKEAGVVPCTIQGTSKQVDEALAIIERKFPEICVAEALVNTQSISQSSLSQPQSSSSVFPTPPCSTVPRISPSGGEMVESWKCELQLASIPTKSFSATVSYIEGLRHVWIVPQDLSKEMDELHRSMSYCYCYSGTPKHTLPLPSDSQADLLGRFCAVRVSEIHWLRGRIVKFGEDMLTYEVQLVDYGSYVIVPPASINPLRCVCVCVCVCGGRREGMFVLFMRLLSYHYMLRAFVKLGRLLNWVASEWCNTLSVHA